MGGILKPTGLYVHVPFCMKKCAYCSFYSVKSDNRMRDDYRKSLLSEMRLRAGNRSFVTVYAGGGTPTLLSSVFWAEFLTTFNDIADTSAVKERTIETNPDTVSESELFALRRAGFNRLSIGVQSFDDSALKILGRIHTSAGALETFGSARKAGFENISIDLMYGIPKQTLKGWREDLKRIEDLAPEHISCYELSVEEGTPIARDIGSGELSKPDEEMCRDMYFAADEILAESGYLHYEVSNYAKGKDNISRHNSAYWNRTPYIGLGPSAHSFDGKNTRSWNAGSINEYLRKMNNGEFTVTDTEVISLEQEALETLMLGLRCASGIEPDKIEADTGITINRNYLNAMVRNNRIAISGNRFLPTAEGMLFADGDSINLIG